MQEPRLGFVAKLLGIGVRSGVRFPIFYKYSLHNFSTPKFPNILKILTINRLTVVRAWTPLEFCHQTTNFYTLLLVPLFFEPLTQHSKSHCLDQTFATAKLKGLWTKSHCHSSSSALQALRERLLWAPCLKTWKQIGISPGGRWQPKETYFALHQL